MAEAFEVLVPLLNPNEPEVQIVDILAHNGQRVNVGDVLCIVETTKSSNEIPAEREGYVISMDSEPGDKLRAGVRLCWLAEKADWKPPKVQEMTEGEVEGGLPSGLRITKPALKLAESSGLSLDIIPTDTLVTEAVVHQILTDQGERVVTQSETPMDPSALVIYGGGGHGKALIDLLRAIGSYRIVGIVDDGLKAGTEIMNVAVLGGAERLSSLAQEGVRQAVNAVGGIGDVNSRIQVFKRLQALAFEFPNLVHPSACVEPDASLHAGVQVLPHAYIGSEARLGLGVIVNTGAVVSHDCSLADYVNIAPGALLAGNVSIGEGVLIGMGVTINLNVRVGAGAKVGNSAVVKNDVPEDQVVRAGTIWPQD
jgi:acetyltransferase EpsM